MSFSVPGLFKAIAHFLGMAESTLEKIFKAAQPYLADAVKYSAELAALVAELNGVGLVPASVLPIVQKFLSEFIKDEPLVEQFIAAHTGSLVPNILHNAVAFVVAHVHNATLDTALLKIDTAVQLAYNKLVAEGTVAGGKTPVASLALAK